MSDMGLYWHWLSPAKAVIPSAHSVVHFWAIVVVDEAELCFRWPRVPGNKGKVYWHKINVYKRIQYLQLR